MTQSCSIFVGKIRKNGTEMSNVSVPSRWRVSQFCPGRNCNGYKKANLIDFLLDEGLMRNL